jgi:hypothetical protein
VSLVFLKDMPLYMAMVDNSTRCSDPHQMSINSRVQAMFCLSRTLLSGFTAPTFSSFSVRYWYL